MNQKYNRSQLNEGIVLNFDENSFQFSSQKYSLSAQIEILMERLDHQVILSKRYESQREEVHA